MIKLDVSPMPEPTVSKRSQNHTKQAQQFLQLLREQGTPPGETEKTEAKIPHGMEEGLTEEVEELDSCQDFSVNLQLVAAQRSEDFVSYGVEVQTLVTSVQQALQTADDSDPLEILQDPKAAKRMMEILQAECISHPLYELPSSSSNEGKANSVLSETGLISRQASMHAVHQSESSVMGFRKDTGTNAAQQQGELVPLSEDKTKLNLHTISDVKTVLPISAVISRQSALRDASRPQEGVIQKEPVPREHGIPARAPAFFQETVFPVSGSDAASDPAAIVSTMIKGIKLQKTLSRDGIIELRVALKPEFLGEVQVKISRQEGNLHGKIMVESLLVKEAVENGLPLFKERLSQMNIHVHELEVTLSNMSDQGGRARSSPGRDAKFFTRREQTIQIVTDRPDYIMRGVLDILA